MTNYEFYKDELIDLLCDTLMFGLDEKGRIVNRCTHPCSDCIFNTGTKDCRYERKKWLLEEHVEIPKLTKKERLLCEFLGDGWINYGGMIPVFIWSNEEVRYEHAYDSWVRVDNSRAATQMYSLSDLPNFDPKTSFEFIKKSNRSWSVAELLLNLEVIEE